MTIPDVNLLVYAHMSGLADHAKSRRWWEHLMNDPTPVGLAGPALYGFIRVVSNPRIFDHPMTGSPDDPIFFSLFHFCGQLPLRRRHLVPDRA